MDNLTHTAIGLFLSRIGLGLWSPGATPIVLIAANIPDIDVVSSAGRPLNHLAYHRHLTHSPLLIPLTALAAVVVGREARGRRGVGGRGPAELPGIPPSSDAFAAADASHGAGRGGGGESGGAQAG